MGSTELTELLRLWTGENGKRGLETGLLHHISQYLASDLLGGQEGTCYSCSLPVFLPFLGDYQGGELLQ